MDSERLLKLDATAWYYTGLPIGMLTDIKARLSPQPAVPVQAVHRSWQQQPAPHQRQQAGGGGWGKKTDWGAKGESTGSMFNGSGDGHSKKWDSWSGYKGKGRNNGPYSTSSKGKQAPLPPPKPEPAQKRYLGYLQSELTPKEHGGVLPRWFCDSFMGFPADHERFEWGLYKVHPKMWLIRSLFKGRPNVMIR